jgi:Uma2 family endonuclease
VSATARKIETTTCYTYEDYAKWPDYPRFELIKGEAIEMSSPSFSHQSVSMALSVQLGSFLRGKKCKVVAAPFDVRINYNTTDNTVVQPDLLVVCEISKIENGKHCLGAPDMIIEILSLSSGSHDKIKKLNIYQEAGVREYWIVNPDDKNVEVFILENGKYFITGYEGNVTIPVHILDGCKINLADIFETVAEEETA